MTSSPRVTIVTATRNRRALLAETVESVRRQEVTDWQMIVVDDASEDDTWAWLQGLEDPRVEGHRLESRAERSAARNFGAERARGDFVLFLDDDDLLPPGALERHLHALTLQPDAVASVGSRILFSADGTEVVQRFVSERIARLVWEEVLLGWVAISGVTVFRLEAFRGAGGWDPSYVIAEDYELWSRLALLGPVVLSPEVVLRYRVHDGQWRSAGFLELMDGIRAAAVSRARDADRIRGERVLRVRRLLLTVGELASQDRHIQALRTYAEARRAAGPLLRSPLLPSIASVHAPSPARMLVKALLPTALIRRYRRDRQAAPASQRGADAFEVEIRESSDGRYRSSSSHTVRAEAGRVDSAAPARARGEVGG